MIKDLQKEIIRLKKEKSVCILAHSYQAKEILEVADETGDSFQLSLSAVRAPQQTLLVCGVHFMAETVKILSPEKKVLLANPIAGCPMAERLSPEDVLDFKRKHPDYTVVCYINTTAALKAVCDVCVTSSTAEKIVAKIPGDKILFLPDPNLGQYVAAQCKDKQFVFMGDGCPVHNKVTVKEVKEAKRRYPEAKLLVHPECRDEVLKLADFAGSTSAIMDYAKKSPNKEFVIGTELSIAGHLSYMCPDKTFYALSKELFCHDMRVTALTDVYRSLLGVGGTVIEMDPDLMTNARRCIDEMIRLGE